MTRVLIFHAADYAAATRIVSGYDVTPHTRRLCLTPYRHPRIAATWRVTVTEAHNEH